MSWAIRPGADLLWRSWDDDDEVLVFDAATGDTHLVNRVTAEVLQVLGRSPADPSALCREVAERLAVKPEDLEPNLGPLLEHLDRIGLVDHVP